MPTSSAPSATFANDLPLPDRGKLTIYLLGPGYGESQVVVFPDGRSMVVDGCTHDGTNLTAALLEHLAITQLEAVTLTHPDLDHVRGIAEVVQRYKPRRIFRYPAEGYVRDLVAMWLERTPRNRRCVELAGALAVLDKHARDEAVEADAPCASTRAWSPADADYTIHFLAPTPFDRERVRLVWRKVVEQQGDGWRLSRRFERLMRGQASLGDAPNAVSLGLVIEWQGRKVLLAGDVENGKRSPKSGWKGVLRILDDRDEPRGHLVENVDLVKVAHHGSKGAFWAAAWNRHARSKKTHGVIAPFAASSLPSDKTLLDLRAHCTELGITADAGGAFSRAQAAGWTQAAGTPGAPSATWLAAVLDGTNVQLFSGGGARLFR